MHSEKWKILVCLPSHLGGGGVFFINAYESKPTRNACGHGDFFSLHDKRSASRVNNLSISEKRWSDTCLRVERPVQGKAVRDNPKLHGMSPYKLRQSVAPAPVRAPRENVEGGGEQRKSDDRPRSTSEAGNKSTLKLLRNERGSTGPAAIREKAAN